MMRMISLRLPSARPSPLFRPLLGMSLLCIAAGAGCGQSMKAKAGRAATATGGVALYMHITDEKTAHALYVVKPDGSLSYGGGFDARDGETTWTDAMSADEIAQFRSLLDEHGWFAAAPGYDDSLSSDPLDRWLYRIDFAHPAGQWSIDRRAAGPHVAPIREFLETVSMRRNQGVFDQLPVPTEGR